MCTPNYALERRAEVGRGGPRFHPGRHGLRPEARGRGAPLEEPAHQEDVDDAPELARSHEAAGAEVLRDGEGAGGDGVEGDGHQGQDGGPEQGVRGAQGPEVDRLLRSIKLAYYQSITPSIKNIYENAY